MISIRSLADTEALADDPVLRREIVSYLLFCLSECDDLDDQEFDFAALAEGDLPLLADLGPPEETASITVDDGCAVRTILRVVYATEVFFVPGEFADRVLSP